MHLEKVIPLLVVDDIDATITFYRELLGFELAIAIPGGKRIDWALLRCGYVEIMFQARPQLPESQRPSACTGITLHFEGEGIAELYEKIKDKVPVTKHLTPTLTGMREFVIRDCNNNLIAFAEQMVAPDEE